MDSGRIKINVQKKIVIISALLMAGKFAAFFITNSVGIFTDAMESIVNVVAGSISLYSLYIAVKPRDAGHPFGHGKIEFISASIEGALIIGAGLLIIYEGFRRLFVPAEISSLDYGIVIVAAAGAINYVVGWYSIKTGKKSDSLALIAGDRHLQSDTYFSIGLVAGLLLLYFTGIGWIDSAIALIFGFIIVTTGLSILKKTIHNLMDSFDRKALEMVMDSINKNRIPELIDIHNMRIAKYGSTFHIDCDITLPYYYTITTGHDCYEKLRDIITEGLPNEVFFTVHVDPCTESNCPHCILFDCPYRKHEFLSDREITVARLIYSDE
ncbi:MAG: cation diffusion facilitator family transporter [Rikenellaceae bacterium]|nr:cation diffusion facilitator family transporter [Rikenellaceae bacterium]